MTSHQSMPDVLHRARNHGLHTLPDHELLALILHGTAQTDIDREAPALLDHMAATAFPAPKTALSHLLRTTTATGSDLDIRLSALQQLHLRLSAQEQLPPQPQANSPQAVAEALIPLIGDATTETLVAMALDPAQRPISVQTVALGQPNTVHASGAQLFRSAVLHSAPFLVLAHNHPTRDPEPTEADWAFTAHAAEAARVLDIRLLDHLVIAGTRYRSMFQERPEVFEDPAAPPQPQPEEQC